jgi:hypothetical protein
MINNWKRFNENASGNFTEDMAMEIVYYISEDSKPNKEIEKLIFSNPEVEGLFRFYESGHSEYVAAIRKLLEKVNKGSLEFKDNMINVYNMIREERKDFPPIIEIENVLISLVDSGYGFRVGARSGEYNIKLEKKKTTMKEFTETCLYLDDIIDDLQTPQCDSTIEKAERFDGFLNDGSGKVGYTEFKITIRRRGMKKDFWTGEISPINTD